MSHELTHLIVKNGISWTFFFKGLKINLTVLFFQIMRDIDVKMRLRPQQHQQQIHHPNGNGAPNMGNGPPICNGPPNMGVNNGPPTNLQRSLSTPSHNYDAQTAMRVRRWIESKTVSNVADCRPYLNAEIQQGLVLKKPTSMNDRSAPRF